MQRRGREKILKPPALPHLENARDSRATASVIFGLVFIHLEQALLGIFTKRRLMEDVEHCG